MNITITPGLLRGSLTPPPSKSVTHRLLLAAALAAGESTIENVALSEDIRATLGAVTALGGAWTAEGSTLRVRGMGQRQTSDRLPRFACGESGSTLRFLLPVSLATAGGGVFTGSPRLMARPLGPYLDLFREKGIEVERDGSTLRVQGRLPPGRYALPGNVSSQFFTGLLYALPLLEGPSELAAVTPLESRDYVTMTAAVLRKAGVAVEESGGDRFSLVPGTYRPVNERVEADWSQAAFWYAAAGLGSRVEVTGMDPASLQGDRAILRWGARIAGEKLVRIDVSGCPDLVPPAAVWGALSAGELSLENAGRLRLKESDRLTAVARTLNALGGDVEERPEGLYIRGMDRLRGGVTVDCCGDHRIAMMAAIAATRCAAPVTLTGAECVNKSYPAFWADYQMLGGVIG